MLGAALLFSVTVDGSYLSAPAPPQRDAIESRPAVGSAFASRPLSFELRLGVATPTGALGIALEYSLLEQFALGCGVGSNTLGWEPGCWLRGRWVVEPSKAYTLSSGLSTSRYLGGDTKLEDLLIPFIGDLHGSGGSSYELQHALWWSSDIGYEYRQRAYLFRAFVGVAVLQNPGAARDPSPNSARAAVSPLTATGYLGFGFGLAP